MLLQQLPDLRLAVFAGCETARAPAGIDESTWPGQMSTADYCVRDACPMVIGMQAVLPFGTERLFTRVFYQAVTGGQTVAEAARLARLAIADDEHAGGRRSTGPCRACLSAAASPVRWSIPRPGRPRHRHNNGPGCGLGCARVSCGSSPVWPSYARPSTCCRGAVPLGCC